MSVEYFNHPLFGRSTGGQAPPNKTQKSLDVPIGSVDSKEIHLVIKPATIFQRILYAITGNIGVLKPCFVLTTAIEGGEEFEVCVSYADSEKRAQEIKRLADIAAEALKKSR